MEIVQDAINEARIEMTDNAVERFVLCFDLGLLPRLHTPRMAKRYGNILSFSLPILKGEVNPVDLMLIEGVRVFYPKLYDVIRDHPEIFIARSDRRSDWRYVTQNTKDFIEKHLSDLTESEKSAAIQLIKRMFPRMEHVFGGVSYDDSFEEHWASQRLIASESYFQRYFSYAIPSGQLGDQAIQAFVDSLNGKSHEEVATGLRAMVHDDNARYLIFRLRVFAEVAGSQPARVLALAVAETGDIYPNPPQMFWMTGPFSQAAMLVSDLVGRVALLEGISGANDVAETLVRDAEPLDFAFEIFRWLRIESEGENDDGEDQDRHGRTLRKPLPAEQRPYLGLILANRVKSVLSDDHTLTSKQLVQYLGVWSTYTSRNESDKYVCEKLSSNPGFANLLLDGMRPMSWGLESGLSSKQPFEREGYESLKKIVNPDIIWDALESIYGKFEPTVHFPRVADPSTEKLIADQFRWLHDRVQKSEQQQPLAAENEDSQPPPH